jgi:hypothetical protein
MSRTAASFLLCWMVGFSATAGDAWAQALASGQASSGGPVSSENIDIRASLERISRGSALWREALATVRHTGRRLVLFTPTEVPPALPKHMLTEVTQSRLLAEATPVLTNDARVPLVLVFVNVPMLRALHDNNFSVPHHLEADLDRIIIHEVYGHGIPYLLAGDLSGRCADPEAGERASDACSIRRENAVRAELGLGHRKDSGLLSLTFARWSLIRQSQ